MNQKSSKKVSHIMLTDPFHALSKPPGVNFINVLLAAFMRTGLVSANNTVKSSVFFALLGSAHTKAARRTLMNLIQETFEDF